jgi:hypothetical protein
MGTCGLVDKGKPILFPEKFSLHRDLPIDKTTSATIQFTGDKRNEKDAIHIFR